MNKDVNSWNRDPEIEDEENLGYDDYDDNDEFFDGAHIEEPENDDYKYK